MLRAFPAVVIENLQPLVDGGRYAIKRVIGEDVAVEADVFKDGHDVVAASLKWRIAGENGWHETAMTHIDNDRWRGTCTFYKERHLRIHGRSLDGYLSRVAARVHNEV